LSGLENFAAIAAGLPDPFRLLLKQSVASTNDEVRILAENGTQEGLIVLAHQQTAGRGRRGAAWFSPPGESLAFSVLLKPDEPKALWPRLALATGLAVAEAIETVVPLAGIKWPNDIWIRQKKIAGILVEAGRDFVVVGIGLNINTLDFPPEVSDIATSLARETGEPVSRSEIFAAIIRRLDHRRHQIGAGFEEILSAVRLRCVLTGNAISLLTPTGYREGICEGIAPGGELKLRTETGLETYLQADEIRLI
jgi:BirA family transcriptional regulator, biotin operon repressor / biotin---[acetyl-CoA-carboxylase] ligase